MATANLFSCEQRSEEWRYLRCGKVTASEIANILAKVKKGEPAGRVNYRAQIIAEVLTHTPQDSGYVSPAMQWGIDQEPFARAAYEVERNAIIDSVGFAMHPQIENFGCSPDGFVGEDGLVQFKCPNTATHIEYLLRGEVPADYQPQMLAEMAVTGRAWCDFVSFDPRLPQEYQLFIVRFQRDEARIRELESAVDDFLAEVKDYLVRLASLKPDGLAQMLHKSVELLRGPQPIVSVMDAGENEIA